MSKWLYREHRGGLKESMKTLKKFDSLYEMLKHISVKEKCDISDITIYLYHNAPDDRIGWSRTYLVCGKAEVYGMCTEVENE